MLAAVRDARRAVAVFDDAVRWLDGVVGGPMDPIAAEVWVFDEAFERVLLVRHRWRGWVPPGDRVEPGESPRAAARLELAEETGVVLDVWEVPAAVAVRSYRSDWEPSLGLSYAAVADPLVPLRGESHQPAAWWPLSCGWESVFPEDRPQICDFAERLRSA